jgi:dTDP-4-amino-4,6-dideoxygalactose transaminase
MTFTGIAQTQAKDAIQDTTAPIPFLDLKSQFAGIREEVMSAIAGVMESQIFILGPEVKKLEEEIATALGARFAIACASGTDALILSLMAAGIGPGDEVITTPFTFIATAGSIAHVGARPVFVDIDPVTFNIDASKIEAVIGPKTRAIMPVHLFGLPADLNPILQLAHAKKLLVVEDAAQALGARYNGQAIGTFGDFAGFSFFPSKNLGGAGDGGMIVTNSLERAELLAMIRAHGSKQKYFHEVLGTNSRLDALQAAILHVKLRHLDSWAARRQNRANRYRELFRQAGLDASISYPPLPGEKFHHVYNQFTIRSGRRDELRDFMRAAGIPTEIYYPRCLHLQHAFEFLGYHEGDLPIAEQASREVLSLPVYPELSDLQQDRVVQAISDFYRR